MSTDRLIAPETAQSGDRRDEGARRPKKRGLTSEERASRREVVAGYVAHLEEIPTADLSADALQRLTLLASEVWGSNAPVSEQGRLRTGTSD
jgi:hypothetical protein